MSTLVAIHKLVYNSDRYLIWIHFLVELNRSKPYSHADVKKKYGLCI